MEVENLRAAFEWGLQNDVQDALELAANMAMGMTKVGRTIEGATILKTAMEKFRALPPVEGDANRLRKKFIPMDVLAWGTLQGMNEIMLSRSTLQEAIAIARDSAIKSSLGYGPGNVLRAHPLLIKADEPVPPHRKGLKFSESSIDNAWAWDGLSATWHAWKQ